VFYWVITDIDGQSASDDDIVSLAPEDKSMNSAEGPILSSEENESSSGEDSSDELSRPEGERYSRLLRTPLRSSETFSLPRPSKPCTQPSKTGNLSFSAQHKNNRPHQVTHKCRG
jgi:hypothetical protein